MSHPASERPPLAMVRGRLRAQIFTAILLTSISARMSAGAQRWKCGARKKESCVVVLVGGCSIGDS